MSRKQVSSKVLLVLVIAGLVLPITICVVLGLASLLAAMNDALGGAVLRYVALAGGVVWIVVLVGLILVQAIHALGGSDDADQ
jgi:purine-cytosine permease-like protein